MRGISWWSAGWDLALIAGAPGSIPGQGTKILATWYGQKKKKKTSHVLGDLQIRNLLLIVLETGGSPAVTGGVA